MAFTFKSKRTANGIKLANKLWDFLNYEVGKQYDTRWQDRQIDRWAGEWDTFLKSHSFHEVVAVFDFYVAEWRKKHGFVHLSPTSFIRDYPLILQRYQWSFRPIPEECLDPVLRPLAYEKWDCDWEALVTSVSKSVYNVKTFLSAVASTEIPVDAKKCIAGLFGNVADYVVHHYLSWRNKHIESAWVATITPETLVGEAQKCFLRLGYPTAVRKSATAKITDLMDQGLAKAMEQGGIQCQL